MSNRRLRTLPGLEASLLHGLHKNNLNTCKDVLLRSDIELVHLLNVSVFVVEGLIQMVCEACSPASTTALQIWQAQKTSNQMSFLSTSLKELDAVLKGGFTAGAITEISGPAGCGKTQLCLMMCIMSVFQSGSGDSGGGAIYIDTESTFSPQRLLEMAENRFPDRFSRKESQRQLLSRVHVYSELHCSSLLSRLEHLEEDIVLFGARLVILDSIASLIRKEFDPGLRNNLVERSKMLNRIASLLKNTADTFSIPVVITNQITTRVSNLNQVSAEYTVADDAVYPAGESGCDVKPDTSYVTVALGNTWSHCVNTRLLVQFVDGVYRQIVVAKSPVAPFVSFYYTINSSGIVLDDCGSDNYDVTDPFLQNVRVRSATKNIALSCGQMA